MEKFYSVCVNSKWHLQVSSSSPISSPEFFSSLSSLEFLLSFLLLFRNRKKSRQEERTEEREEKRAREKERPDYSVMAQRVVEETEVGEGDLVKNQVMLAFFLQGGRVFPDRGHHECCRGHYVRSNSLSKRDFHPKFRIFHSGFSDWTEWTNQARESKARQFQNE